MRTIFKGILFLTVVLTICCNVTDVFASDAYFVWEKTVIDVPLNSSIKLYEDDYELSFYVKGQKSDDYIVEKEVNCSTFSTVLTHIIGKYTVYYKAYSKNNGVSSTQAIIFNVVDNIAPIINLEKEVLLEYGEKIDFQKFFIIEDNYCKFEDLSCILDDKYVLYNMLGTYQASLVVKDKYNNSTTINFDVKIVDNTKPQIYVLQPLIFSYNEDIDVKNYFKVIDNYDQDITNKLSINGLDTTKIGEQNITVSVSDRSGNTNVLNLNVNVEENVPPQILLSDSEIILNILNFNEYDIKYFSQYIIDMSDNYSNELALEIDISSLKERIADFDIFYILSDEYGNVTKEKMTVKMREFIGPTLIGEDVIYININEEVDLLSLVEVVDLYDDRAYTRLEIVENTLDVSTDGVYEVKYQCFNNSGKCTEKTIRIVVGEGNLNDDSNNSILEKIDIKVILIVVFAITTVALLAIILIRKKRK